MSTTTIVGNLLRPDTTVPRGTVVLNSTDLHFVDPTGNIIGGQQPYVVSLDAVGHFSQEVLSAANGYTVTPNIDGVTFATPASYTIAPVSNPFYLGGSVASAPTTLYMTGTWSNLDQGPASGTVEITPFVSHFTNNGNIIFQETITAILDANGHIAVKLIKASAGYKVVERINGAPAYSHWVAGTANLNLSGGVVATVPGPPFSVAVAIIDGELITVWTPPTSDGGIPVLDYTVVVLGTDGYSQSETVSANLLFVATFDGIQPNVEYSITVTARNDIGSSSPTSVGLITWNGLDTGTGGSDGSGQSSVTPAPDPPTNLSVTAANEAVFVNWKTAVTGFAPVFYIVTCTGQPTQTIDASGASWQKCLFSGLTNGNSYTVTVAAVNFGGTSSTISTTVSPSIQRADKLTAAGDMISGYTAYSNAVLTPNAITNFTTNTTLISQVLTAPISANAGVTVNLIGCKIQASTSYASILTNTSGTFNMKYCEIDGSTGGFFGGAVNWGLLGSRFTLTGCYLHHCSLPLQVSGDTVTVKWSLIKDLVAAPFVPSGISITNGNNINLTGNLIRIAVNTYDGACIFMRNTGGTISNVTIANNYLDGGLWGIATRRSGSNVLSNVTITNNRWLRAARAHLVTLGGNNYSIVADNIPTGAPTAGSFYVASDLNGWQAINYHGLSAGTTFTGCSGGTSKATPGSPSPPTWSSTTTYAKGAIVNRTTNGVFTVYASDAASNKGNDPITSNVMWHQTFAATIRLGSNLTAPQVGGLWFAGGYNNTVDIDYVPTGTYVHTGNVWDDAGTAVPGL